MANNGEIYDEVIEFQERITSSPNILRREQIDNTNRCKYQCISVLFLLPLKYFWKVLILTNFNIYYSITLPNFMLYQSL